YGGQVQVWGGPWSLDHHLGWASVRGRRGHGLEAALSGSASQGWGEARLAPRVRLGGTRGALEVSAGPAVRTDGVTAPGATLQLWATRRLHARWSLGGWTHAHAW